MFAIAACTEIGCAPAANPPADEVHRPVPHRPFSDPVLERLANAGAQINRTALGDERAEHVSVRMVVDESILQDLARLVDSDARTGPLASLDEIEGSKEHGPPTSVSLIFHHPLSRRVLRALEGAKRLSELHFAQIGDAAFADVTALPSLRVLWMNKANVGDNDLRFLDRSPLLEEVFAADTRVGDDTLARLEDAHGLKILFLRRTKVTDAGLRHLSGLSELESLKLSGCAITGAGLVHLEGLQSLKTLELSATKLTDPGLANMPQLPKLKVLDISETRITDDGIRHLIGLKLFALVLKNTKTSDACLPYLAAVPLGHLDIDGTGITAAGIGRVFRDPPSTYKGSQKIRIEVSR